MDESRPEDSPQQPQPQEMEIHDDLPGSAQQDDELDGMRIQLIAKMRRSAYRSRGYLLIASVVCVALAGQLVWLASGRYRGGALVMAAGFMLASLILLALAWRAMMRARELKGEADRSLLDEPKEPPDFSKLGDGSQAWRNLEDVE